MTGKIADYMKKHHMIQPGDTVIAAVSGGADSVALLLLLSELTREMEFTLFAVHVEHGIRGGESLKDMRFTRELSEKQNIPLRICHVDAPAFAARNGMGLEEAARTLRYQALEEAADTLQGILSGKDQKTLQADKPVQTEEQINSAQAEEPLPAVHENKNIDTGNIKIALAHHMQDQAETVLFRLARGSGVHGLSGMRPVRYTYSLDARDIFEANGTNQSDVSGMNGTNQNDVFETNGTNQSDISGRNGINQRGKGHIYIRPLLAVTRSEIEEYLTLRGQDYCVDSTNQDENYARNRIRLRVLPELSRVNSQAVAHIAQAAEQAAEMRDYIEAEAERELRRIATAEKYGVWEGDEDCAGTTVAGISIDIPELGKLHPALQKEVLRQALILTAGREKDLTAAHVRQILELTEKTSGKEIALPYQVKVKKEFDRLVLVKDRKTARADALSGETSDALIEVSVTPEQLERLKETGEELRIRLSSEEEMVLRVRPAVNQEPETIEKGQTERFAFEKLRDGFLIRHRQPGDFFYLKDGHRKKLKQYLIEKKIPASRRQNLWIVACGPQAVWLVGGRTDPMFLPEEDTEYVLWAEYRMLQ